MKKEEKDKLKKLFNDVKNISDRLEKFKIAGEIKEIKESGNATHIIMNKNLKGKKALVIILPDFENM